jgi:hypothetical protein
MQNRQGEEPMPELPASLVEAIERGELTPEQLAELIRLEARALGFDYEEAVARAKAGTLPKTHIGADLSLLVDLLAA